MTTAAASALAQTALNVGTQVAITYAQSAIANALDNRRFQGPRLERFRIMSSTDGAPLPRVFGRVRLGGQVIWATHLRETETEEKVGGGKGGGPTQVNYSYTISFAVALCEGEIAGIERIWANGDVLATDDLSLRVHRGTEDQLPDPLITAVEGEAPAYRGTAYLVFEDFPLDSYGARLPQINVEVIRPVQRQDDGPRLEDLVTGVNLLPGSGEFAYQTTVVEERGGRPGAERAVNMNSHRGVADALAALDQLERDLPNCRHVSIISSWFGTDLRMGHCELHPGVESRDRKIPKTDSQSDWSVGPTRRNAAYEVSQSDDGHANYGGTPSDASLVALIRELKARGFGVTLYPFILMDVPPGNGLSDPYGSTEQAAFPWRGRITATGDATAEARSFFGDCEASDFGAELADYSGPEEWGFRRFILHHAAVARAAGGVDRFLIGTEMRGVTTSGADAGYPAVGELRDLLAETRILLPDAELSYAADWSEYFGHHTDGGLVHHLDPLWAETDAVAIDAYFPLSDWRDGDHLDAELAETEHDITYLAGNVEGGEGYDWYYATDADRAAQVRTPIDDPAYAYKNLRHWWSQSHRDADGPTPWVPESKPIWLTEVGCPAVDRGANQPNVFVDPKSSESFLPYHSSGRRDDLIQRNYLRALLSHYRDDPMIDGMDVWCWDARPFPDFPARSDVWSDGPNWQLGHWLSGRMGRVALADIIAELCRPLDVEVDVRGVAGLVEGFALPGPMSVRASLVELCAAFSVDLVERPGRLVFRTRTGATAKTLADSDRADTSVAFSHAPEDSVPGDVRLRFIDGARDHQPGSSSGARRHEATNAREIDLAVVMDDGLAETLAERILDDARAATVTASAWVREGAGVEVGDTVRLPGSDRDFLVTALDGPTEDGVELRARSLPSRPFQPPLGTDLPTVAPPVPSNPAPAVFAFELPGVDGLAVGAMREPWLPVEVSAAGESVTLARPVRIGALATALSSGPTAVVDRAGGFEVSGLNVALDRLEEGAFLAGGHRFAVEHAGGWEVLAARDAELVGPDRYRLGCLLRGLHGSSVREVPPGTRVVWLNSGVEALPIPAERIGETLRLTAIVRDRTSEAEHIFEGTHLRPLAPVHLRASREGDRIRASWIRRTRGADSWTGLDVPLEGAELYLAELLRDGGVVASYQLSSSELDVPSVEATELRVRQGSAEYGWGAAALTQV